MTQPDVEVDPDETLEFLRRAYSSTREWYGIAERKAQLVLGANGILVTVVFGTIFGKIDQLHALKATLQPDTWILAALVTGSIVGAVSCACLCMWSLHGKTSMRELDEMGVHIENSDSYCAEALWYFGYLATLDAEFAREKLQNADRQFEIRALSYHMISLSKRVCRKHKYINAGWALTGLALIFTVVTAFSIIVQI